MTTSPHDPEKLAAELLDEVHRARAARARPVPWLLRSPELMALAPPLREKVLAHARRAVATDPNMWLALALYGAAVLGMLFAAPDRTGLLLAVGWAPALLIHTLNIRRAARRLARDLV
jgi:hypothetical protein